MNGEINNGVWVQVERPEGKTVLESFNDWGGRRGDATISSPG